MKILILEDEWAVLESLVDLLKKHQYLVEAVSRLRDAEQKLAEFEYDLLILDLSLPDGDGLQLLKNIQNQQPDMGVLILSARDSIEDKTRGLWEGADDYLPKPFHSAELLARVFSILRRKKMGQRTILRAGTLAVDTQSREVSIGDDKANLTPSEYDLLLLFLTNPGRMLTKAAMAEHLSGDWAENLDQHDYVYAHIKNLKKKLGIESVRIQNIYGIGYRWKN